MRNFKLIIAYDGSRYQGWQRLNDSDLTIQGKLEKVISEMIGSPIEIIGSGRTDAGVHARGQVANFHTNSSLTTHEIHRYINQYLPQDIVVTEVVEVSHRFHSRYNAKSKKYVYAIWNHWIQSPFDRKYSYYFPTELDIDAMKSASRKLIGTHDFIGFSSLKKVKKSTVRTIYEISIEKKGHLLNFNILGNGFLYNMIRIIMGSLIDIGLHKRDVSHIEEILANKNREDAGMTIPPHGLFLEEVHYQ
ncbi:tRNA pseudouridine(38-40) synthase TruA [Alkalibaculum sp. M08DMB]|uniref:tRNA pseudouridine synthase A n=1 Tax=Alkalibaculum sporogenes TaxID=2655001 RepID=A0A6A7K573_9FIRM|nr:tRNA pseudouridine(38-40) synthase TruA [Alkalibaculum sporogenes]MPW24484.1 tRNA pseudouridine(38-40) synthase TruA [Alkalibaculum sporogenes]